MKKIFTFILLLPFFAFSQSVNDAVKLLQNEQPEKAKNILRTLFSKNKQDSEAGFRLGNLYYELGKKDSAKIVFNECAQAETKPNYCLAGMAKVALDEGNE